MLCFMCLNFSLGWGAGTLRGGALRGGTLRGGTLTFLLFFVFLPTLCCWVHFKILCIGFYVHVYVFMLCVF